MHKLVWNEIDNIEKTFSGLFFSTPDTFTLACDSKSQPQAQETREPRTYVSPALNFNGISSLRKATTAIVQCNLCASQCNWLKIVIYSSLDLGYWKQFNFQMVSLFKCGCDWLGKLVFTANCLLSRLFTLRVRKLCRVWGTSWLCHAIWLAGHGSGMKNCQIAFLHHLLLWKLPLRKFTIQTVDYSSVISP